MDTNENNGNDGTNMNDKDVSFLQQQIEKLTADKEAIRSEFANADVDTSPEAIRKAAIMKAPEALERIATLGMVSDSDSTKFAANKFLVEIALGIKLPAGTSDEATVATLLKQLAKNDAS